MPVAPSRSSAAFSLIEVVIAVGIFAIAIVSIVGLLVPIRNSVSDVRDTDDAARVAAVIQAQLQEIGFQALARTGATPVGLNYLNTMPAAGLFASRDGTKVGLGDDTAKWGNPVSDEEKFFKVELIRNTTLSPDTNANDTDAGYLAFTIKLTWPAFASNPPGGPSVVASPSQQSTLLLPAAITR
jgi:type II secretory pathway pseudopilin PulG